MPTSFVIKMTLRSAVVLAALFVVSLLGMSESQAQPPTTPVPGCVVNGNPVTIQVEDSVIARFDGSWMSVHTASGAPIDHSQPVGTSTAIPVCAVQVDGFDFGPGEWLWCTDMGAAICNEGELETAITNMTEDTRALVSWLIGQWEAAGVTTSSSLTATQHKIWCLTDDAEITVGSYPPGITTCPQYQTWLETEILPDIARDSSSIDVVSPTDPVHVGSSQTIEITSTLRTIELTVTGADSIELCDPTADAELVGTTLTINDTDEPVEICVTRDEPGTVELTASSLDGRVGPAHVIGYPRQDCQVMFVGNIFSVLVEGSGSAEFIEQPTTTTTSTTTTTTSSTTTTTEAPLEETTTTTSAQSTTSSTMVTTTTVAGSTTTTTVPLGSKLPATGSELFALTLVALALLAGGGSSLLVAHRRNQ